MILQVFRLCPLRSRAGGAVVGVRFACHEEPATVLKLAFAQERESMVNPSRHGRYAGGWLPHPRCRYVELAAWNAVRTALIGCDSTIRFAVVGCPNAIEQFPMHGTVAL